MTSIPDSTRLSAGRLRVVRGAWLMPILLIALGYMSSASAADGFANAQQFIASVAGALPDRSTIATGDLNGDGRDDLAIVVQSRNDQPDNAQQLYVLTRNRAGRFVVAASSQKVPITGRGCCWVESLAIEEGQLTIQNNAKTACNMEVAIHRFKRSDDQWRLIGVRISDYRLCEDPQVTDTRAIDVLTGSTKHSHEAGGQTRRQWTTDGAPGTYQLEDYDFSNGFGTPGAR